MRAGPLVERAVRRNPDLDGKVPVADTAAEVDVGVRLVVMVVLKTRESFAHFRSVVADERQVGSADRASIADGTGGVVVKTPLVRGALVVGGHHAAGWKKWGCLQRGDVVLHREDLKLSGVVAERL